MAEHRTTEHTTLTETTGHAATAAERVSRPDSLSIALAGHRNSLGVLRLVLATLVIFSHAFPLGGWGEDPMSDWTGGQESLGGLAVVGFFAISGYLIAKSGSNADVVQFFWRRALRIFPAFWLVLLVGALIVGPIAWVVEGNALAEYPSRGAGGPLAYLAGNWDLTIRQWGIYDIFATTTPYGQVVGSTSVFNGSLWTLAYEWGCYLIIGLLVVFGVLSRARILVVAVTLIAYGAAIANLAVAGSAASLLPYFSDSFKVTLTLAFLIGSSFAVYSRSIPFDNRLGVSAGIVAAITLTQGGWVLVGYPAFAYFLLWLAAALPKSVQWIGARNDYSYGMYVYGFLVQQITASLGWYQWGYIPWVTATIVITAGCAWVSWHLIEKRALRLKDWGPGRGIRFWVERAKVPQVRLRRRTEENGTETPVD